jgi:hypothetical protein
MIATLKRLALFCLLGAFFGDVLALVLAPSLLRWFQTPAAGGALCNCATLTEETARALVRAQGAGVLAGATLVVVAGEAAYRFLDRKRRAAAAALVSPGPR